MRKALYGVQSHSYITTLFLPELLQNKGIRMGGGGGVKKEMGARQYRTFVSVPEKRTSDGLMYRYTYP